MMNNATQNRHRLRNFIAALAILAGILNVISWSINKTSLIPIIVSNLSKNNKWNITLKNINFSFFHGAFSINDIDAIKRDGTSSISAKSVNAHISYLGLLRGKLIINDACVSDVNIDLTKMSNEARKKHSKINLANILILKNLDLKQLKIENITTLLPKSSSVNVDEIRFSMNTDILNKTHIKTRVDGLAIMKGSKLQISLGAMTINGFTGLNHMYNHIPYIRDMNGKIEIDEANLNGLVIDKLYANANLNKKILNLVDLDLKKSGNQMLGNGNIDIEKREFQLSLDIAHPIHIPFIGKPIRTIDTAGDIEGSLFIKGKGFSFRSSSGECETNLKYKFSSSPKSPLNIFAKPKWHSGIINLGIVKILFANVMDKSTSDFIVNGTIDLNRKKISLNGYAEKFPIELIFDKFRNKDLNKIFGNTDIVGTFEGWGKNFTLKFGGITSNGGWQHITSDTTKTRLEITYEHLKLSSDMFYKHHRTGQAELFIKYGARGKDGIRKKTIVLDATINDHNLASSLSAYGLSGIGTGKIHLEGPSTHFKGTSNIAIKSGVFYHIPFNSAFKMDISNHKMTIFDANVTIAKLNKQVLQPIKITFKNGLTHFTGNPLKNLKLDFSYLSPKKLWRFSDISWHGNDETRMSFNGSIASGGAIRLRINGNENLKLLRRFFHSIRNGKGKVKFAIDVGGITGNPTLDGKIIFKNNDLWLSDMPIFFEDLSGSIRLTGHRIYMNDLTTSTNEGNLKLHGWVTHKNMSISSANMSFDGTGVRYISPDKNLRMQLDGKVHLNGNMPSPTISGSINVIDAQYSKDFTILDALSGKKTKRSSASKVETFNPKFNLNVKNTGDVEIKNNVGRIWLTMNINISGNLKKPSVAGTISTSEGKIHYLGMNFDITNGFVEFRKNYKKPYLEVKAQHELGVYNINLTLFGSTDNLKLDLSATSPYGPLEKRDVVSLILFGMTEQERYQMSQKSTNNLTTSIAARSGSAIIERPITKFTHLDTFRLETSDKNGPQISRIYLGKQLSDRLNVDFSTDINSNEAVQTITTEYKLTDAFLIHASRSTNLHSEIGASLRFRLR